MLEEFFDLIKSLHERPNKDGYNGQKKLFNMVKFPLFLFAEFFFEFFLNPKI